MQFFFHHILEAKYRLVYIGLASILSFLVSYLYRIELVYLISKPFLDFHRKFIFLDLTEALYTMIYISAAISFIVVLPFVIYQFWAFFIPSTYSGERARFKKFLWIFFVVFLFELLFIYFFIFPLLCGFFMSFEIKSTQDTLLEHYPSIWSVELAPRLSTYFQYTLHFFLIILCLFQIPFLFIILYSKGLVDTYSLCKKRKYVFFSCLLIAASVSPPDVLSQSILSLLIYGMYEIIITLGLFFEPVSNKEPYLTPNTLKI